ncbi:MAG TPA: hypothetical protein VFZ59_22930 [Verrucomicrobiae bacterium]|nr:hypothetical protein [Verrucomicrobiae bacterium]
MTTAKFSVSGNSLTRSNTSRALPFIVAARKPNRPLPMISLRVPVTPENRRYLRELRDAELRAWKNTGATRRRSSTLDVGSQVGNERRDLFAFGLIVALTAALAAVVLAQSPNASQRIAHWVSAVRQVLG